MIYIIKHTEYVKIGYSSKNNFKNRLSQLQTSCPIKIKVLGLIEGTFNDEAIYHKKFIHLSTNGEWFNYTKEVEDFIDSLPKDLMWDFGFIENESTIIGLIKKCRLEKNLSMEELAERLGVTKQAVLDMERREAQGKITLNCITNALSVMGFKYQGRAVNL
jgi:DNA-binding XRE family transcriptional regulator